MNIKTEKSFLFCLVFLSLLSGALMIQTSFLPVGGLSRFVPYLTWPPLVFVFLYHSGLTSLGLLVFVSVLSGVFFSLSIAFLFFLYLLCFFIVFFIKNFSARSPVLFFISVFVISLFFPYLLDVAYDFSINDFSWNSSFFYFFKSLSTLLLSFPLFPLFKKYLQPPTDF